MEYARGVNGTVKIQQHKFQSVDRPMVNYTQSSVYSRMTVNRISTSSTQMTVSDLSYKMTTVCRCQYHITYINSVEILERICEQDHSIQYTPL